MVPKVSIILPNYNGQKYLKQAVDSVIKQSFEDFELIIVDDASTDLSKEIISGFEDDRITTCFLEKNRQIAYALNYGLQLARGEYVARIDSDDIWQPDKLEKQVEFMDKNKEYGACFSRVYIIDDDASPADKKYSDICQLFNEAENRSQKEWVRYFFDSGNCLCHSSAVIRKSALDQVGGFYNMACVPAEDFELWSRLVVKYPIYILDDKLVKYRWSEEEGKNSGNTNGKQYSFFNVHMVMRRNYFYHMNDEEFVEYFGDRFINSQSREKDELECEKAAILLQCSDVNVLGLEKYEELLREPRMLTLLEEKYNFSLVEYYKEYRYPNYYGAPQQQSDALRLQRQQQMLDELLNSTSWKLTKPLRKIGEIVRKYCVK